MIHDHLVQAIQDVCDIELVHYGQPYERFHHSEGPKIHLGHVYNISCLDVNGQQITETFAVKICTDMLEGFVKYVGVWPEFKEGRPPINSIEVDHDADLNGLVNWVVEQMDNAGVSPVALAA